MLPKKAVNVNLKPTVTTTPVVVTQTPGGKTIGDMKMYFLNRKLLDENTTHPENKKPFKPFLTNLKNALNEICKDKFKSHINNQFNHWSVLGFLTRCCKSETISRGVKSKVVLTEDEELVGIVCLKKKGDKSLLAIPRIPDPTSNKKYTYEDVDIGIGGKDLYIDLLCAAEGYGKSTTSYVEKLARKYGYEKIVLNAVHNVIDYWKKLGFINLEKYYNVDGKNLENEGVRMEKEIKNNKKTNNDEDIDQANFEEITNSLKLQSFLTNNVTGFGNPIKISSEETVSLELGATDDLNILKEDSDSESETDEDTSESKSGGDSSESETDEDTSLKKSVTSPVQQIAQARKLIDDIGKKNLPTLLADALSYTLFQLEVPEKNDDVDFFVNLIQKDYNEPDYERDIYNGGIYVERQVDLFKESILGDIIRDSFRDNFGVGKKELDENSNLKYFEQENKQDSDTRQMEFFEQVMEKIKRPPNAEKEYPFITRESEQMDRTFEYIKSLFAEYRRKFPSSS